MTIKDETTQAEMAATAALMKAQITNMLRDVCKNLDACVEAGFEPVFNLTYQPGLGYSIAACSLIRKY